jgi:hypothetical protein
MICNPYRNLLSYLNLQISLMGRKKVVGLSVAPPPRHVSTLTCLLK